ncbi:hypothetical protein TRAPUB_1387 [Trametes pubescens]|uniref:Uncharacterized protein n=1 Tax=Trametes pubescens TaxID=154538 RepID=A0A1M2VJH1_TRAPU|nr:hypothetical protein TRAPUB_1387 [Trametes pubescens]
MKGASKAPWSSHRVNQPLDDMTRPVLQSTSVDLIDTMTIAYVMVCASRGIGLEYVPQLAAGPDALVFAIVRNKKGSTHLTTAAANLKNSHIVDADVVDHASQERAANQMAVATAGNPALTPIQGRSGARHGQALQLKDEGFTLTSGLVGTADTIAIGESDATAFTIETPTQSIQAQL